MTSLQSGACRWEHTLLPIRPHPLNPPQWTNALITSYDIMHVQVDRIGSVVEVARSFEAVGVVVDVARPFENTCLRVLRNPT